MSARAFPYECRFMTSERVRKYAFPAVFLATAFIYIYSTFPMLNSPSMSHQVELDLPITSSPAPPGRQGVVPLEPDDAAAKRTNQSSFFTRLLGPNDIKINAGGIWSGKDTAAYHKLNHASGLSDLLVQFFKREGAQSVIDLGGGSGLQAQNFNANGIFASCYDGNPDTQAVSNGTCAVVDLTKPLNLAKHDWVLSLSVGRQIPPKYEDIFVRNVDAVNRNGIIIYWGDGRPVHGQMEKSVRNNSQVIAKFEALGSYVYDKAASTFLRGPKDKDYSVLVFRRKY